MSLATVYSRAQTGMQATLVSIEVHLSGGLPKFNIVGLPEAAVKESKDRVRSAIINNGFDFPVRRITVNLAPADLPKQGGRFDLPIAIGILAASKQISAKLIADYEFAAELALSGVLRPIKGVLPLALGVSQTNRSLIVARADAFEASITGDLKLYPAEHLMQVCAHMTGRKSLSLYGAGPPLMSQSPTQDNAKGFGKDDAMQGSEFPVMDLNNLDDQELGDCVTDKYGLPSSCSESIDRPGLEVSKIKLETRSIYPDMADVMGQVMARRALEIAAAGGHSLLMSGPPGSGKTMLARRLPGLLPDLTKQEALDTAMVYSLSHAGFDFKSWQQRPFRAPHHSASSVALAGGGNPPHPGEISLAHNGVLFLDELPEFKRSTLEVLRQPIESGFINIARAAHRVSYPARFQLIAAMNPCPCGYLGDPYYPCRCSPDQVQHYQSKISGPLLDRIDLHVEVARMNATELIQVSDKSEASAQIKARVMRAHQRQMKRQGQLNVSLSSADIGRFLNLSLSLKQFLQTASQRLHLSVRSYHRMLKLALTVADLAESHIEQTHLQEALSYRPVK